MSTNLPAALKSAMRLPVKPPEAGVYYTPVFRVAFPHLDEPWAGTEGKGEPAFSIIAVFDNDADLSGLIGPLNASLISRFGNDALSMIQHGVYKYPLRPKTIMASRFSGFEGNGLFASMRARREAPAACLAFLNGKSQPTLLQIGAIERHIYAGSYAYAAVSIFNYDKGGGKGVSMGLRTLVKVADGERFGGPSATSTEEAQRAVSGLSLPPGLLPDNVSGGLLIEGKAEPAVEVPPGVPVSVPDTPPWNPAAVPPTAPGAPAVHPDLMSVFE